MPARNHLMMCIAHPIRERFVSKALLAFRLILWLFWLPAVLRIHTIPRLLNRLARSRKSHRLGALDMMDAVRIIKGICNLRLFRSTVFPRQCLRQSLALYRTLTQLGYPVAIHFGILKNKDAFEGHSWVTVEGEPVADTAPGATFKPIYSYPPDCGLLSADGKR
jgi:hypothetical protein